MKRLTLRLSIAFAGGMGLTLVLLWLLSNPRTAGLSVAYAAEWQVCLSGCPYASIQDAVDAAGNGDVIKVAAGTYTGVSARPRHDITTTGVVTQVVYVSKTITIQGGYTLTNWTTPDPIVNPTTLDAESKGRVLYITGDISPVIEGLRFTGGNAAGPGGQPDPDSAGGGVYVISAAATIRNNWALSNTASFGGGLYLQASAATLAGNIVISNSGNMNGGGLFLDHSAARLNGNFIAANSTIGGRGGGLHLHYSPATLSGNTINANSARRGGGLYLYSSPATLSGNTISANSDHYFGGGGGLLLIVSDATLNGNLIISNTTNASGGGLRLESSNATLTGNVIVSNTSNIGDGGGLSLIGLSAATVNRNIIASNIAVTGGGGGLYMAAEGDVTLINNLIADNQANSLGSGLYIASSSPQLLHTTIARNKGGDGSGIYLDFGATLVMTNTILVSQTVGITVTGGSTATLLGTLWGSGAWANGVDWGGAGAIVTGTINVFGDPDFVDPDTGDYHIGPNSAALDAGVDASVMVDIDSQPRAYQAPDLGADEYWPPGALKYIYLPLMLQDH